MRWLDAGMKWLMLVAGALTCMMFYAAAAPTAAIQSMFGVAIDGPVADIVVRNWGVLIGLIGVMLIYGAFNVAARPLVLTIASLSKLTYIGLMLMFGRAYLSTQAGVSIAVDVVMVILFLLYLSGAGKNSVNARTTAA